MDDSLERQVGQILATVESTKDRLIEMRIDITELLRWKAQTEAIDAYQKGLTDGQNALRKSQWALILGIISLVGTLISMGVNTTKFFVH